MHNISEMSASPNALPPDLIKQWLTELTSYTPQEVDTAIAQIEQQRTLKAQHH